MTDEIVLGDGSITAVVTSLGAELVSLRGADDHEHVWSGAAWPWHAPILFPQICRANDDRVEVDGSHYPMPHHGVARDQTWQVHRVDSESVQLTLVTDARLRESYPFEFALTVTYRASGGALVACWEIENRDTRPLPFMLGWHPGFRWPLDGDDARDHVIELGEDEPEPPLLVEDNLLSGERAHGSVTGERVPVSAQTFAKGGLILRDCRSTALVYRGAGRSISMTWEGFPTLTLHSPPDGGYVCLEPWAGLPETVGQPLPFIERDGVRTIAPRERWTASCTVRPGVDAQ